MIFDVDRLSRGTDCRRRLEVAHTDLVNLCRRHLIGSNQTVRSVINESGRSEYEARKGPERHRPSA